MSTFWMVRDIQVELSLAIEAVDPYIERGKTERN